ncbi:uncharacterized protein YrzB (UPF0473 family) [Evansella vedderi]|uniref:Uncharacterized protein YrzB (UPF0473 family) n=1 Tax=Evansella vedderi TaxID=38282 RepID=A0ABU0A0F1_9BACI|nr:DUF1292 domain-containing protein [Evansella vedderi]MDQ0256599.1 uncharacterized protein YrzB (UPF0473 family) [Evansella vedderi]
MSDKEYITIHDEDGNEKIFEVEAMFDMGNHSYAMISSGDDTLVMRIEEEDGEQVLVSATEEEVENLMDAYNIAIDEDMDDDRIKH